MNRNRIQGLLIGQVGIGQRTLQLDVKNEVGNPVIKAVFKSAMVAVRANPAVGLALVIADITGLTDWIFKW